MTVSTHPDYDIKAPELKKVRLCIEGADAVKRAGRDLLPHPSDIDTSSPEAVARYKFYLAGAEFNGKPNDILRSLIGKMRIGKTEIDLGALDYLVEDADGDGMPMRSAISYAVENVLQTKFHSLVADYVNAPAVSVTKGELKKLNARPTIKQYTREAAINWAFGKYDNITQLIWIKFQHCDDNFDPATGARNETASYLTLGLDDTGYYQQKSYVDKNGKEIHEDPNYVTVGGKNLRWLPVVIFADSPIPSGELPKQLGYMSAVCEAALSEYRVSAVYKETQAKNPPTLFFKGARAGDDELFKTLNGRSYVLMGNAANVLPENWDIEVVSPAAQMEDFHWYFDRSKAYFDAVSGQKTGGAMTATEAEIIASDQNALLESIAQNAEESFSRAALYCGMFDGLWGADDIEKNLDKVFISLPRDFSTPKITVEERQQSLSELDRGVISRAEVQRQLGTGGALIGEVDEINEEIEEQPPTLTSLNSPAPVAQNSEVVPNAN